MTRQLHAQTYVWLQVFACAARHLSFTRCAEELHITPGAVSQQIRQLEERLGFRLFHRRARGVELSAEGQRLAITVNEAYGSIDAELRRLDAGMISGTLRLRSIPSFLGKWLTPRLPRLQQRFPRIPHCQILPCLRRTLAQGCAQGRRCCVSLAVAPDNKKARFRRGHRLRAAIRMTLLPRRR